MPFCAERCDYCEFYSVAVGRAGRTGGAAPAVAAAAGPTPRPERLLDRFVAALLAEWERERERFGVRGLETVFVGGGTPSLLGQERLERLLEPLEALLTPRAEITVETNPEDVTADVCRLGRGPAAAGVARRAELRRPPARGAGPARRRRSRGGLRGLRAAGVGAPGRHGRPSPRPGPAAPRGRRPVWAST